MADKVKVLPVVRVEQCDGSHEHPEVQRLRAEIAELKSQIDGWKTNYSELLDSVQEMLDRKDAEICALRMKLVEPQ